MMATGRNCIRTVDVIDPKESVQIAARRMFDRNVGSLVVVNEYSEPIGIVTDRDLAIRVLAEAKDAALTPVSEVMTATPHVVNETTEIEDLVRIMRSGPCRRLPVVNSLGQLIGLITLDDVLALLSEEFRSIGNLIRNETPGTFAATA
jgi:CBS domain-containing protein